MSSSGDHDVLYGIEERPPLSESIALGFQHILAMLLPNLAPVLIIASVIGFATNQTSYLVQMALLFAGVATIIQAVPIGPVGARLPIVMGTSFTFVGGLTGIANQYSVAAVFGAAIAGALVEGFIGWKFEWFRSYFTPLVNGLIVTIIGLYLIPVGMDYLAGGAGAANYGSIANLTVGGLVFVVAVVLNQLFEGYLRTLSMLIAVVVGYVVSFMFGMVDLSSVASASWFAFPVPLRYGVSFKPFPVLVIALLFIATSMENVGHLSALTALDNRSPTTRELKGGLLADGLLSCLGSIFGALPNTSFAQNVGVVTFTRVMSRFVVAIGGVILLVLGFVPKVGALIATMPNPVLGGVTLIMFGMILSNGLLIIKENVELDHRNMLIIAVSISLGLGVSARPKVLSQLPTQAQLFFGQAVVITGLAALILDTFVSKGTTPSVVERSGMDIPEPSSEE